MPLRNVRGSKDLAKGTGCSWRKYSSGVWKVIPTLEAKSLEVLSTRRFSLVVHSEAYLSEHAWSAFALVLAARPPASPTKNEACKSGPSPSSRSK